MNRVVYIHRRMNGARPVATVPRKISQVPYQKVVRDESFSYNLAQHFTDWHKIELAPGSAAMPAGLTLTESGVLNGTATVAGMNQTLVIRATNTVSGLSTDEAILLSVAQRPAALPAAALTELTPNSFRITKPTLPANTPAITSIDLLHGPLDPLTPSNGVLIFNSFPGANTNFDVSNLQPGDIRHVTLRAKAPWGDGTFLTANSFSPNVATITLSGTNTAPVFSTAPSISPATGPVGTVFDLLPGVASGQPSPNITLTGLTQGGIDVLSQVVNSKFTSTSAGVLAAVWQASNGVAPNASAQATAQITTVAQAPGQMVAPALSVVSSNRLDATVAAAPASDGGSTITSYEIRYSLDQVNWTVLAGLAAGELRSILGLRASRTYYVQNAARNGVSLGPWSPSAVATTSAASGTTLYFGQHTIAGSGAVDTSEADGTYGQFTVAAGKMTPNISPLTLGDAQVGSTTVSVVAGEYSVASLAEFASARADMGVAGGRTIRFRPGSYNLGLKYTLANAAYLAPVHITTEAGATFIGSAVLDNPSRVTLSRMDIQCTTTTEAYVLRLAGACDGCIIEDNYFHGVTQDPLGNFATWQSYQNPDQGILADAKNGVYLKNCLIRRNKIEHVDEGIVTYFGGSGPYIFEHNDIGYTYSDAFKYVLKTVESLSAVKKWNRNRWYMMMGRQDDLGPAGEANSGPHSDFLQLVRTTESTSQYVDNVEVIQNIWILTAASRGQNLQGMVSFDDGVTGGRPIFRNMKFIGNFIQSDSVHACSVKVDGGIWAHNTVIRTLAPKLPAPLGKGTLKARFYLDIPAGAVQPQMIRNVCDFITQQGGNQMPVEIDNIYLGDQGATIPYTTAFSNGGVEANSVTEALANFSLKAGGPLDMTFGRGAFGSGVGTWGSSMLSELGFSYNPAFEMVNPGVVQPLSINPLPFDGLVFDCERQTTAKVTLTGKGTTGQQIQVRGAAAGGNTSWYTTTVDAAGNWKAVFNLPEAQWAHWYATEVRVGTDDLTKISETTRLWGCGDTVMLVGQSQVEHSINFNKTYSQNYAFPVQTNQNLTTMIQNVQVAQPAPWFIRRHTSWTYGQVHVGIAALAEAFARVLPNRKLLIMDGCTSGTSIYDMVNDNESSRLWENQTYPIDLLRSGGSDLGVFMIMWQADDAGRAKTYAANTAPIFIGQRWGGEAWTLGTSNPDDGPFGYPPIHHILWDCEVPPDQYGRGYFTRDRTKLMFLEYPPFNAAPTTTEGLNYTNGVSYAKQLDRPARDQLRLMHADPRFPTVPGMYGPGMHIADYDGGVHPRNDSRWGTPYAGLSFLYPILMWARYGITEPKIITYEAAADGSYVDAVIDMPPNGVLTTLRKFNALPAPTVDPAHRQEVTGFEIRRAGVSDANRRPIFRTAETAYPADVRGTVVVQDSGSGTWPNRRAMVRITPVVPIAAGDGFDFGRGDATSLLLEPRDYDAQLWLDMPIAHIPALYDATALYPAYGIPVQPQPPFMLATAAPSGATAPNAFTAGQWSLGNPGTGGALTITISALPVDGGSAITALQYTKDGGTTWTTLGGVSTGTYTVTGFSNGVLASVQLRAVNSINPGAASDVKTQTPTGDTTKPILSTALDAAAGSTGGTGTVSTNEAGGTLYVVATTSSTAPTAAQVKAGQNHLGAAAAGANSTAVPATGARTITVNGLTAATAYWMHFMHEDAAGNLSDVMSADGFSTDAAPVVSDVTVIQSVTLMNEMNNVGKTTWTGANNITIGSTSNRALLLEIFGVDGSSQASATALPTITAISFNGVDVAAKVFGYKYHGTDRNWSAFVYIPAAPSGAGTVTLTINNIQFSMCVQATELGSAHQTTMPQPLSNNSATSGTTITAAGTTVQPGSLLVGHAALTRRSSLPSADLTVSSGILLGAGHSGGATDLKTGYFIGGYKAKPTAGADSVVFTLPETGPRWSWQTIEVFRA